MFYVFLFNDNLLSTPGREVWLGVNRKEILLIYITRDSVDILCYFRGILQSPGMNHQGIWVFIFTLGERLSMSNWSCIQTTEIDVLEELSNIINEFNKMLI